MSSDSEKNSFQQFPVRLKFNKLPPEIRGRLLERMDGKGKGFVFKYGALTPPIVLFAAAILWFVVFFIQTDGYAWSDERKILLGIFLLGAAYLLIDNGIKLVRHLTSRAYQYLLITPLYVIDIENNDVSFWNLEQLVKADNMKWEDHRSVQTPEIVLRFDKGEKKINVGDIDIAERTVEEIEYLKKKYVESIVRNDFEYLDANDDFLGFDAATVETKGNSDSGFAFQAVKIAASLLLAAGAMFAGLSLNNYFDDKISWQAAQNIDRASSYRNYLQTHPNGRWTADANEKLKSLYDSAGQKYRASLNKGFDEKAVEAISEILKYAKETQNYRIKVEFAKDNKIPPNLEEELKEEFEVKKILPLGDSLSDEKMKNREKALLGVVADALRKVIPDDILEFSNDCSENCVKFKINYKIDAKYSLYYDTRQEKLTDAERIYYPGILIDWDFSVQLPNQTSNYNFKLDSIPAEQISYDSKLTEDEQSNRSFEDILKADLGNIYDSMVASAFDDFRANLIYKMGIGEEPKRRADLPDTDSGINKMKPK
ncbi:MAG: hypothetical protein LUM44_13090 [Pyrinomonadaceae bacterium]|nr:hypothetical protein [Pyrinomonadaceae bacterium]